MKTAYEAGRSKGFRNRYLAPLMICLALIISVAGAAQITTTDSIRVRVNQDIRNTAIQAFTNLRLNTILQAMLDQIDSARAGTEGTIGVDTMYTVNDSTLRYKRDGNTFDFNIKGIYDNRRKVDTAYALNDSTLRTLINGATRDVVIRGAGIDNITTKNPITKTGDSVAISYDPLSLFVYDNALVGRSTVVKTLDELRTVAYADTGQLYYLRNGKDNSLFRYDPDESGDDDTAMIVENGNGDKFVRVIDDKVFLEWFDVDGTIATDAAPAFNRMFRWLEAAPLRNYTVNFKGRKYFIGSQVDLPGVMVTTGLANTQQRLRIDFTGVEITTTYAGYLFYRMPTSDAESTSFINNYKLEVIGGNFGAGNTVGSVAFKVASTYGIQFEKCHFQRFDTALSLNFSLNGRIKDCFFTQQVSVDIVGASNSGYYSGASVSNSAFNANTIEGCRFFSATTGFTTVMLMGADQTVIRNCITEGSKPRYNFYYDDLGNTGVLLNTWDGIWIESTGGPNSPNVNFYLKTRSQTQLRNVQRIYADTLLDMTLNSGAQIYIDNIPYLANFPAKPFKLAGGSGIYMRVRGVGNGLAQMFLDTAKWVGAIIPLNLDVEGFDPANGGIYKGMTNPIIETNYNNANNGKQITFKTNMHFLADNIFEIGGRSSVEARPNRIRVGTNGIRIDKASTLGYGFGSATQTVVLNYRYINDSVGLFNTTGALRLASGTTAQRPAATASNFRYNSTLGRYEWADGSTWYPIADTAWTNTYFVRKTALADSMAVMRDSIADLRAEIETLKSAGSGSSIGNYTETFTADDSIEVTGKNLIVSIIIIPASTLAALKVGTTNGGEEVISEVAVGTNGVNMSVNTYLTGTTMLYFTGITSDTEIEIITLQLPGGT